MHCTISSIPPTEYDIFTPPSSSFYFFHLPHPLPTSFFFLSPPLLLLPLNVRSKQAEKLKACAVQDFVLHVYLRMKMPWIFSPVDQLGEPMLGGIQIDPSS